MSLTHKQNIIQSANVDWVSVAVTTEPQKISDLLQAAGFHTDSVDSGNNDGITF